MIRLANSHPRYTEPQVPCQSVSPGSRLLLTTESSQRRRNWPQSSRSTPTPSAEVFSELVGRNQLLAQVKGAARRPRTSPVVRSGGRIFTSLSTLKSQSSFELEQRMACRHFIPFSSLARREVRIFTLRYKLLRVDTNAAY